MILRHLLKASRLYLPPSYPSHQPFSTTTLPDSDNHHQPEVALLDEEDALRGKQPSSYKNRRNNNEPREPRKFEGQTGLPIIFKYLMMERPQLNQSQISKISQASFEEQIDLLRDLGTAQEEFKMKPLQQYERRLNLSTSTLSRLSSARPRHEVESSLRYAGLGENRHLSQDLLIQWIKTGRTDELRQLYDSGFFLKLYAPKLCNAIVAHTSKTKSEGFLLNVLYESTESSYFDESNPIYFQGFKKVFEQVSQEEIAGANPIKYYWYACKNNQVFRPEISPRFVKQSNKITVNGVNLERQFSHISLFLLKEKTSSLIMSEIIRVCKNLDKALGIWAATLTLISRIQSIIISGKEIPAKLNFNDIFKNEEELGKDPVFHQFFHEHLPKILFKKTPAIFEVYQRALKYSQEDKKNSESVYTAPLNVKFGKDTRVTYKFQHDPFDVTYSFGQAQDLSSTSAIEGGKPSLEKNLAISIAKGNYKAALDYYYSTLVNQTYQYKDLALIKLRAQQENFNDPNMEALFILKELALQQGYIHNPHVSLTNEILGKTLGVRRQDDSQFFNTRLEGQRRYGNDRDDENREKRPRGNEAQPRRRAFANDKRPERYNSEADNTNKQLDEDNSLIAPSKKPTDQKATKTKSFFGGGGKSGFCSSKKDIYEEQEDKEAQKKHYEQYLKVAKQTKQAAESAIPETPEQEQDPALQIFDFKKCNEFSEVSEQFAANIDKINEKNLSELLLKYNSIPIVERLSVLVKYYFLKKSNPSATKPSGLLISFNSSMGAVEKDYGEYIADTYFKFALPDELYVDMLFEQNMSLKRKEFKRICAHLMMYSQSISDEAIKLICKICSEHKIGVTLLEIMNLLNAKKIKVSYESLKEISASVQKYRNMESDLVQFFRNYSEHSGISLETALFEQYIGSLTASEQYQKLNEFLETLKFELKIKEYKINEKLTPAENIEAEKKHKNSQLRRFNNEQFTMLEVISRNFKPRTKIPEFIPEMFQVYMSQKLSEPNHKDFGVGLIINALNENEFLNLLLKIKDNSKENNDYVMGCAIRAIYLFAWSLKPHLEKILNITIYGRKAQLTDDQLRTLGYSFKQVDMSNIYSEFLQFLLKTNVPTNPEIKSLFYKIFNSTSDDYSKSQISSLLDFMFNPTREKEREEYKKIKEQEEKKSLLLKELSQAKTETPAQNTERIIEEAIVNIVEEDKETKKEKKKAKKEKVKQIINATSVVPAKKGFAANQMVYNAKMAKIHLRNRPLRIFLETYMKKYEPSVEEEMLEPKKEKNKKVAGKRK